MTGLKHKDAGSGATHKKTALDYVRLSPQYVIYVVLIVMFWMWTDISEKTDVLEDKIQNVQVTLAVQQTSYVALGRLIEKVEKLEVENAIMTTTITTMMKMLDEHNRRSNYEPQKKGE